jgi:hypothetical protein
VVGFVLARVANILLQVGQNFDQKTRRSKTENKAAIKCNLKLSKVQLTYFIKTWVYTTGNANLPVHVSKYHAMTTPEWGKLIWSFIHWNSKNINRQIFLNHYSQNYWVFWIKVKDIFKFDKFKIKFKCRLEKGRKSLGFLGHFQSCLLCFYSSTCTSTLTVYFHKNQLLRPSHDALCVSLMIRSTVVVNA